MGRREDKDADQKGSGDDLRSAFKTAVSSKWSEVLTTHGFQLIDCDDTSLYTSYFYQHNLCYVDMSIDWREGDIEAKVGTTIGHPPKSRVSHIWNVPHRLYLESYIDKVVPEQWEALQEHFVADVQVPEESLTTAHIQHALTSLLAHWSPFCSSWSTTHTQL